MGIHAVVSEKSYGSPWVSKASGKRPGRSGRTTIPSSVYRDPSSSVIGNGNGALIRPGKCTVPGKGGVSAPKTPLWDGRNRYHYQTYNGSEKTHDGDSLSFWVRDRAVLSTRASFE